MFIKIIYLTYVNNVILNKCKVKWKTKEHIQFNDLHFPTTTLYLNDAKGLFIYQPGRFIIIPDFKWVRPT
jgi:hypothetical protein